MTIAPSHPLRVIGILRSCFREKFGTPRQPHLAPAATAALTVASEHVPAQSLAGLERFSHVWLLSYFHLNTNKRFLPKVHPPRLKGRSIGAFASRSPHRPSPIGLSLARLVKIEGATLHLRGIDLVDGTPILDIKPYVPESDCVPDATAGWTEDAPFRKLAVDFAPRALSDIAAAEKRLKTAGLAKLLTQILGQDVRNPRDRSQSREGLDLGFFLYDFEARFWVKGDTATVLRLETGSKMHKKERRMPSGTIKPMAALLAAAFLSAPLPACARTNEAFQREVEAAAAGPLLRDASWAASVMFADTGERLAAFNAEKNLAPASSLKLLASAAAWSVLGEDYRFRTQVLRGGPIGSDGTLEGDLILLGGGDPTLGSTLAKGSQSMEDVFASWTKKLAESGVKRIAGAVVADNGLYGGAPIPGSWSYEDVGNYFAASADALSINDNLYKITFAPGKKAGEDARLLRVEPEVPGMRFVNLMKTGPEGSGDNGYVFCAPGQYAATLRGTVPAGPQEFAIKGALPEPALFAAQAFQRHLEKAGILVSKEARLAQAAAAREPSSLLAQTLSPPLRDIVYVTHKRSFNLYAEMLARALGARRGKGAVQEGLEAVKDFLRGAGIDVSGIRLFDACGLSRYDQVKAETLTRVLVVMAKDKDFSAWRDTFVVPGDADATGHIRRFARGLLDGKLWIKSGSLSGVRGYSGYVKTAKGRLAAFTFIVNGYSCSPAQIEELHEKLLLDLSLL